MGVCQTKNKLKRSNTSAPSSDIANKSDNLIGINKSALIHTENGSYETHYIIEETVGEGSYGQVARVKHKQTNQLRAMKIIKKSKRETDENIRNEINILKTMDHPNIVKIFEYYITNEYCYIITELCHQGELFEDITFRRSSNYSEEAAAYIIYQVLLALFYCHSQKIVHCDLKPENILIGERDGMDFHKIKLIDFGTAKYFENNINLTEVIGSSYYMAPEVLNGKYNEKCDLWSCGVILYILLCLSPPFSGNNNREIQQKIRVGHYDISSSPWDRISNSAKKLIEGLLKTNPEKRLTAEQALNHEWFKKFKTKDSLNFLEDKNIQKCLKNIFYYQPDMILQQATLAYLVHNNLHMPQVDYAMRLFNLIDINNDGHISKDEFVKGFNRFYKKSEDNLNYSNIFEIIDADKNGYIEYEEFIRAAIDKSIFLDDEILQYAFRFFDKDGSGQITIDEFQYIFFKDMQNNTKMNEFLKKLIDEVDKNGDGNISYEEFKDIMVKILK